VIGRLRIGGNVGQGSEERPTSRRDFLREGLRSLVNAGFGGVFEKLERVGELMERGEPKPAPLMPILSCESRALHPLLTAAGSPPFYGHTHCLNSSANKVGEDCVKRCAVLTNACALSASSATLR
jgi:hypothetical protein